MDLRYTDEQQAYREAVRDFADEVLAPMARTQYDFGKPLARKEIQAMAVALERYELATVPPLTEVGGYDLIYLAMFIEEISRIDLTFASLANALFFQVWDMASLLVTQRQQELYGHMFGRGEMVAIAMSEPEAASNPAELRTRAARLDDGWQLDGRKIWISHAGIAAGILVAARKEAAGEESGQISLFMVGAGSEGCECRPIETIGMDGVALCEVTLTGCRVPLDADLTPGSGGLRAALGLVEQARLKIVFMAVGLGQAALDLAVGYARERRQSGRPIASFQLVQEMLAEMSTLTECARLLGYQAASAMMAGQPARAEVSRAKAYATEAAVRVTSLGIQVHGAMGLTRGYPAEKLFRDARMLTIPDGTTEIHKLVLGRELTGINALH
jgi:alkylation response protein AidB-like acyl-CoA dehydrogenase